MNVIFAWLGGLMLLLGVTVWLGHRPGPRWPVVAMAVVFSLAASAAIGSIGLSGFVQTVCNYSGFCP
jgi:putative copper export protein